MKTRLLIQVALIIAVTCFVASCGVSYEGKYGDYTLTPAGTVIIEPHYAK